jgi:hypothetical protein
MAMTQGERRLGGPAHGPQVFKRFLSQLLSLLGISDEPVRVSIDSRIIFFIEKAEQIRAAGTHRPIVHFLFIETSREGFCDTTGRERFLAGIVIPLDLYTELYAERGMTCPSIIGLGVRREKSV